MKPTEENWSKNTSGLYVPPQDQTPHVEPVRFAVKVTGFIPPQTKRPAKKGEPLDRTLNDTATT